VACTLPETEVDRGDRLQRRRVVAVKLFAVADPQRPVDRPCTVGRPDVGLEGCCSDAVRGWVDQLVGVRGSHDHTSVGRLQPDGSRSTSITASTSPVSGSIRWICRLARSETHTESNPVLTCHAAGIGTLSPASTGAGRIGDTTVHAGEGKDSGDLPNRQRKAIDRAECRIGEFVAVDVARGDLVQCTGHPFVGAANEGRYVEGTVEELCWQVNARR